MSSIPLQPQQFSCEASISNPILATRTRSGPRRRRPSYESLIVPQNDNVIVDLLQNTIGATRLRNGPRPRRTSYDSLIDPQNDNAIVDLLQSAVGITRLRSGIHHRCSSFHSLIIVSPTANLESQGASHVVYTVRRRLARATLTPAQQDAIRATDSARST